MRTIDERAHNIWVVMAREKLAVLRVRVEGSCDSGGVDSTSVVGVRLDKSEIGYSDMEQIPVKDQRTVQVWSNGRWEEDGSKIVESNLAEVWAEFADDMAMTAGANYNNEGTVGRVEASLETYTVFVGLIYGREVACGPDEDGNQDSAFEYDDEENESVYEFPLPPILHLLNEVTKEA